MLSCVISKDVIKYYDINLLLNQYDKIIIIKEGDYMDLDDEELEATRRMHNLQKESENEKLKLIKEIVESKFLKYDENEDEFYYEDIIVNKQIEKIRKIVGE